MITASGCSRMPRANLRNRSNGAKGSILVLSNDHADPNDESDWPNQVEWMANALEKFADIFPPLLQEFAAGE